MSAPRLRVPCPVCAAPAPLRNGRFEPHDRPARPGEPHRTAWCEGRDREASPEAILEGLNALVAAAAGDLRAACTQLELAEAEVRRAHTVFQRRRTVARRVSASLLAGLQTAKGGGP